MKIIEKDDYYELVLYENAVFEDYENVLNYLIEKMNLTEINEIDDFDTHYQLLNYKNNVIVLYYNNSLGISIYFNDSGINKNLQQKILTDFLEVLKKRQSEI